MIDADFGPAAIAAAAERIRRFIARTPLEYSPGLSERTGSEVWLKFECFQPTGSFKIRGAFNALLSLTPAERGRGIVTASAGNHGLGVARAAAHTGTPATIVVPETASPAKLAALRQSGAHLITHGPDYDAAEAFARDLSRQTAARYISPYNDPAVIAGGGTIGLEILNALPDLDAVVVPAGGGGLLSGVALAVKEREPRVAVYGVQPAASPAIIAALQAGRITTVDVGPTLADGLAGNLEAGSQTVDLIRRYTDGVLAVTETALARAIVALIEAEHVIVEGSGAAGVAALLEGVRPLRGRRVAVILTGRNIATNTLRAVLAAHKADQEGNT